MKEREANKGAVKRVILKTIRNILIIDISVIIIWSICFFLGVGYIEGLELSCWMILYLDILPICFFGSFYISEEKDKVKAETAEDIFREDNATIVYPKVFPKKGHFKQSKFFEKELPQIADYYANLYENGEIEVVAKFKDCKTILHVEYIKKENFIDAYDVLETTLTDSLN